MKIPEHDYDSETPLSLIDADKSNPKAFDINDPDHRKSLGRLTADIKERGMLNRVILTPYRRDEQGKIIVGAKAFTGNGDDSSVRFWMGDGHRRFIVTRKLGGDKIRSRILIENIDFFSILEMQMVLAGKDIVLDSYNGVEIARGIARYALRYSVKKGLASSVADVSDPSAIKKAYDALPEEMKTDAINRLVEKTGYSANFFESRLAILTLPEYLQKTMLDNPAEGPKKVWAGEVNNALENLSPEREPILRQYSYQAAKNKKLVSTLDYRTIGYQWKRIEASERYSPEEKLQMEKAVVDMSGRSPSIMSEHKRIHQTPRFEHYQATIASWIEETSRWQLKGLTPKEMRTLSSLIHTLLRLYQQLEKQAVNKRWLAGKYRKTPNN